MDSTPIHVFGAFHFLTALLESALKHSDSALTLVTSAATGQGSRSYAGRIGDAKFDDATVPSGYVGLVDARGRAYVLDLMDLVPHVAAGGAALVAVAEHHCAHARSLGTVSAR